MKLYVKEYDEHIVFEEVKEKIVSGVEVERYCHASKTCDSYILVSEYDPEGEILAANNNVLFYEKTMEDIDQAIQYKLKRDYDYLFLNEAIKRAKKSNTDTIVSGSSYALFGIDECLLENEVNCSLMSQDLYYSYKIINEICSNNADIKNVIIICNYYYFYSDLSKTENEKELKRISNVYYPLLGDKHNAYSLPSRDGIDYNREIFDIDKIYRLFIQEKNFTRFFNDEMLRKNRATKKWEDRSKKWSELSEEEREDASKKRADDHNKSKAYFETYEENGRILDELVAMCLLKGIGLYFIVAPTSKWYSHYLDTDFKKSFYSMVEKHANNIRVIDMNDFFEDDIYFNDMDHLSDLGANIFTKKIFEIINGK